MRINEPVTDREFRFSSNSTLMSTTDTQSHITYANAAFISVSGFDRVELLGQPHNMVRHPDMPQECFQDMWETLRAGKSWTALVKNRRKDGDHYWVRANATPVIRGGKVTGYMSVRTCATDDEVSSAAWLYAGLRKGTIRGFAFRQGVLIRTGWLSWVSALKMMPVRWQIRLGIGASAATSLIGLFALSHFSEWPWSAMYVILSSAAFLAWWLEAQISSPLRLIEKQALSVAAGQPGQNIHLDRVDEIGMILRAVNQAGLNLRALVDDVREQASGVRIATAEIAQANMELRNRTEATASNLESSAASMEQMTASIKNTADAALHASELAIDATNSAANGGRVVEQVVDAMKEITASSHRISDITSLIDGIAFQTNILALNAAVEAARAGEMGRGFAVVAGEVRTLAQRCAEAAKEIRALITTSVETINEGATSADAAGSAMRNIVAQVQGLRDLLSQISGAAAEQSSGIVQFGGAIAQVDRMTQQNAAMVEQSAAAAESLKDQAERLAESVNVF